MKPQDAERRLAFEALVLMGIWQIVLLLKFAFKMVLETDAILWRGNAISYLDQWGIQGEDAKRVRRERSFPES